MNDESKKRVVEIIGEIETLHPNFVANISKLEEIISSIRNAENVNTLRFKKSYLVKAAYRNALIKLRLILEQNFINIETLGLLAVTRYIFEALLWLRLLDSDPAYGLVFYGQVVDKQIDHLKGNLRKVESEIALFEALWKEEKRLNEDERKKAGVIHEKESVEELPSSLDNVSATIDRKARRSFCLYADDAKKHGYGYQAHLLNTQVLPKIQKQLDMNAAEKEIFLSHCSKDIKKKLKKRWNWFEEAKHVGMQDQYKFLYSYTSRLLHATPASIFTDQKNLEYPEMKIFLDYIYVSLLDVLELSEKQLSDQPT